MLSCGAANACDVSGNQFGAVFHQVSQQLWCGCCIYLFAALFYGPPSLEKGFKEATCRSYALTPLIRTADFFRARRRCRRAKSTSLCLIFLQTCSIEMWEKCILWCLKEICEWSLKIQTSSRVQMKIILVCCLKIATFVIVDIWHHCFKKQKHN